MKSTAIILSGGKGKRLGADIPKQYLEICDKPILAYTLMAFQKSRVDDIVIVAAAEYEDFCKKIASDCGCSKLVRVVTGGAERYDSVLNGLRCIDETESIALIHDGARPFIKAETIDRIIAETAQCGACIAATPCTDTIKLIDEEGNILSTTNRKLTWAAQTPQSFFAGQIREAYEKVIGSRSSEYDGIAITDDAMVYQLAFPGKKVKVVDAGKENTKITTASDLDLASTLLGRL